MEGAARVGDDDPRAVALGERLKAWFAALSGRPVPKGLLDHVDTLERQPPAERPDPEAPAA
ncbi:MAG TPA: hypothetical protein VF699_02145 [Caulobacteraceae bacterium]|jgi:hypothetical protein